MVITHKSKYTCKEVELRIEKEASEIGLMMKKHFPFSQNLPKNGFEINTHASVFELCKPSVAAQLLNTQPELNVLMPCRISVYEKDGACYVSMPDLTVQLETLGCEDTLKNEILGLYNDMTKMIKGW